MSNKIVAVFIETEGTVNSFFQVLFEDNTTGRYWSCDQGGVEPDGEYPELDNDTYWRLLQESFKVMGDEDYHDEYRSALIKW